MFFLANVCCDLEEEEEEVEEEVEEVDDNEEDEYNEEVGKEEEEEEESASSEPSPQTCSKQHFPRNTLYATFEAACLEAVAFGHGYVDDGWCE